MHRVLGKVATKIGEDPTPYNTYFDKLKGQVEVVHWNEETQSYADRGFNQYAPKVIKDEFAAHHGYVSLFPLLLQLLPHGPRTESIIRVMGDEKHLLSKAGLRSLSPLSPLSGPDPIYGTQEDYWRGKVWINMNYLALQALHKQYGGESAAARALYHTLRATLVSNMLTQWLSKGFLFEQYHDKTGHGLKHKPFAGWSALILLIMAEKY